MTPERAPATRPVAARRRPRHFLLYPLILLLASCAGLPLSERLDSGISRFEDQLIELEQQGFVGQVTVVHAGNVVLLEGYGTMGVHDSRPVTPDSVFPLASLSKPFTASARFKADVLAPRLHEILLGP